MLFFFHSQNPKLWICADVIALLAVVNDQFLWCHNFEHHSTAMATAAVFDKFTRAAHLKKVHDLGLFLDSGIILCMGSANDRRR